MKRKGFSGRDTSGYHVWCGTNKAHLYIFEVRSSCSNTDHCIIFRKLLGFHFHTMGTKITILVEHKGLFFRNVPNTGYSRQSISEARDGFRIPRGEVLEGLECYTADYNYILSVSGDVARPSPSSRTLGYYQKLRTKGTPTRRCL